MKTLPLKFKRTVLSVLVTGLVVSACSNNTNNSNSVEEVQTESHLSQEDLVLIQHADASTSAPSKLETLNDLEEIVVTSTYVRNVPQAKMRAQQMKNSPQSFARQNDIFESRVESEKYAEIEDSGIFLTADTPVSTFSIDVDTGAYSNVRRFLNDGMLPPSDAVRTEELINYFSYQYPSSNSNAEPFSISTEVSKSPWNDDKHLVHIGLQAVDSQLLEDIHSNLVFLLDVSGSMNSPDKLGLLKTSLKLLSRQLGEEDRVSIVVYAGASGVVLKPTPGNRLNQINRALEKLSAGGGTNGEAGIQLAYSLAQEEFIKGGINRVILATDGDFNVGTADVDELKDLIAHNRKLGVSLTTLGFGTGNYNDHLMEQLADVGNGNYAYIDNINEARKVLVDELSSTLRTVAKDVKIQVEFNPSVVAEYRLLGYENRALKREDFNNDKVDAGEIGAGHTVTAIYEIALQDAENQSVDPLRYGANSEEAATVNNQSELAYLKLRYKAPEGEVSQLLERAIQTKDIQSNIESTSDNYRFSAAVAGLAQLLRNNNQLSGLDYEALLQLAINAKGKDEFGYRSEFINLVRTAQTLSI